MINQYREVNELQVPSGTQSPHLCGLYMSWAKPFMKRDPVLACLGFIAAIVAPAIVGAAEGIHTCPLVNKDLAEVAMNLKVVAVGEIDVEASQYKPDGNADTLELVFLGDEKDSTSRVSEDGQVVFVQKQVSSEEQQALFKQAFYIRAVLEKNLTSVCTGPWTRNDVNHSN